MPPKSRPTKQRAKVGAAKGEEQLTTPKRWLSRLRQTTTAERVSVASAAVAALAAVAIFIVTWAQWRVLSSQLEEMREASAQSAQLIETNRRLAEAAATQAAASQRAATAAERSAETARQSQLLSRRAWVGPYSVGLDADPKDGKPTKLIVKLKNTGREPAQDVSFTVDTFVGTQEERSVGDRIAFATTFCLASKPKEQAQVIYPQSDSLSGGYELKKPVDNALLRTIGGSNVLLVVGCVTYNTAGETHHSAFCYFYNSLTGNHAELNICSAGNRAD